MAQRRMFSLKVVDTDTFLDMSPTAQNLYFHLGMRADDDGFVANPKKIMKIVGAPEDDMRVLIAKNFIIPMATSGVSVITHWKTNNLIKNDRYTETIYKEEKSRLIEIDGKYGFSFKEIDNGSKMVPEVEPQVRIGKDSIDKVRIGDISTSETSSEEKELSKKIGELIKAFESINPASSAFYGRKNQREACKNLIKLYSFEKTKEVIESVLPKTNGREFYPTITTPVQLFEKWSSLQVAVQRDFNKSRPPVIL